MNSQTPQTLFMGIDPESHSYEQAKVVVFPAPYERTTSYLKGTVNGPQAILEASEQVEYFDCETKKEAYEYGIFTHPSLSYQGLSQEQALQLTEESVLKCLKDKKFPVLLGGEHTISIAPLQAVARYFGSHNISVLHFDAHSDMRDTYHDNKFSHASIMRRVHEVVPRSYSIGIRAQCIEEYQYLKANPERYGILYDYQRAEEGLSVKKALHYLPTEKIYLTIDLDYFCPEEMPSVGTPVPGGGNWYETMRFLREIFRQREVVGVDVVELKPDHDKRSDFFAAQLVYKLLSYKFD